MTIDTKEFRDSIDVWRRAFEKADPIESLRCWKRLVAHIDAQLAASRAAALRQAAEVTINLSFPMPINSEAYNGAFHAVQNYRNAVLALATQAAPTPAPTGWDDSWKVVIGAAAALAHLHIENDDEREAMMDHVRKIAAAIPKLDAAPPVSEQDERALPQVLKGIGKINGDGWKDVTKMGEVVFVWNAELPRPYKAGQYPRIGKPGWSASTTQYDFEPATVEEARDAIEAALAASPAPSAAPQAINDENAKGYRPPFCDRGVDGSRCCNDGCAADRELAEMGAAPSQVAQTSNSELVELMKMSESASVDTLRAGLKLAIEALCEIAAAPSHQASAQEGGEA